MSVFSYSRFVRFDDGSARHPSVTKDHQFQFFIRELCTHTLYTQCGTPTGIAELGPSVRTRRSTRTPFDFRNVDAPDSQWPGREVEVRARESNKGYTIRTQSTNDAEERKKEIRKVETEWNVAHCHDSRVRRSISHSIRRLGGERGVAASSPHGKPARIFERACTRKWESILFGFENKHSAPRAQCKFLTQRPVG